jgi:hypothetical protein
MADNKFEIFHRLNTTHGLLVAVLGGQAVNAAIGVAVSAFSRPALPWIWEAVIAAVCSAAIFLVIAHSRSSVPGGPINNQRLFKVLEADWGNIHHRELVDDIIPLMPQNALVFHVNPDALKPYDPRRADPAPGPGKYIEITYSSSLFGKRKIKRKEGEWVILPEDPYYVRFSQLLSKFLQSAREEIDSVKAAGKVELLVADAVQLALTLEEIFNTLRLEGNEDAIKLCIYPLSIDCFPRVDSEWRWHHRRLSVFQNNYNRHRQTVMSMSIKDFTSVVTSHPLGSADLKETTYLVLPDLLRKHSRGLAEKSQEMVNPLNGAISSMEGL